MKLKTVRKVKLKTVRKVKPYMGNTVLQKNNEELSAIANLLRRLIFMILTCATIGVMLWLYNDFVAYIDNAGRFNRELRVK